MAPMSLQVPRLELTDIESWALASAMLRICFLITSFGKWGIVASTVSSQRLLVAEEERSEYSSYGICIIKTVNIITK